MTKAMEEAGVSKTLAIDVYQWLRDICSEKLLSMTIKLGGPGTIVQVDKSLFRHTPKVNTDADTCLTNSKLTSLIFLFHSITEGEGQHIRYGFLAW